MGLFDSRKTDAAADDSLDALVRRARAGDAPGAFAAGNEKLGRVEKRVGAESPAYAAALFEFASLCLALGMVPRAVASMRAAADIRGTTHEDERNRLTYLMNLGDTLGYAGQLEEALAVHERGLRERESFYGNEHPGYAYGLDGWADVAIAAGRYEEALAAARKSMNIYDVTGHQRLPHAWALVFLAGGGMKATWTDLRVGPPLAHGILDAIAGRHLPVAPAAQLAAVEVVAPRATDSQRVLAAWAAVQRRATEAGDHASCITALEHLGALAKASGNHSLVLQVERGLGLAHDKAGDHAAAARDYERAIACARSHGSPADLSATLRNAGLYFVEREGDRGLAMLREAVSAAPGSGEERSRSGIALGIQLQHRGALDEARTVLAAALGAIDPAHPDAICGRSHLRAIEEEQSCGCGDVGREVYAQVERIVRERLPSGLVDRIDFEGGKVDIRVTRALSEAEARQVADTVDLAMSEMRKRIAQTYGQRS
jgi:tetratricopeptide (TPR) repeat protein